MSETDTYVDTCTMLDAALDIVNTLRAFNFNATSGGTVLSCALAFWIEDQGHDLPFEERTRLYAKLIHMTVTMLPGVVASIMRDRAEHDEDDNASTRH